METAGTEARELTRYERAAIRKLVVGMCANYDPEYGFLPLDYGGYYMLDKWWTGAYCRYFQNAVLPLDPVLEAILTGRTAPALDTCAACGKPFVPKGRQAYCSPACQTEGNRRRSRERMRKKRQFKGV
jgi:predicted nucleic acid-binding Zn ribbon protein